MATIVHFNVSASDPLRAMKFYKEIFDWTFDELDGPVRYYLIKTKDLDGNAGLGGGLAIREEGSEAGVINFIGVKSIDDTLKKITDSGGTIVQATQALPGWGYLAVCKDTEGNAFGLFSAQ